MKHRELWKLVNTIPRQAKHDKVWSPAYHELVKRINVDLEDTVGNNVWEPIDVRLNRIRDAI